MLLSKYRKQVLRSGQECLAQYQCTRDAILKMSTVHEWRDEVKVRITPVKTDVEYSVK